MTEAQANATWDLLVRDAGTPERDRAMFVSYLTEPNQYHEYRFQGLLGFGGKLHHSPARLPYIGCYPEDRTPERAAIIETVNAQLADMFGTAA